MTKLSTEKFQSAVLTWFDQHGRKNLPWQQDKTPYRVWVSEIMLQQTQVNTVMAYFQRFMQRFPTIKSLATAHEDEVLHLWTGLGYYTRARNLHRTAKIIVGTMQGKFPDTLEELTALPGIGLSTAGAILASAFQKKATILDGNVKRVLTRFHAITEWPGEKKVSDKLWLLAEKYTPSERVADYTQAIMDIGAMICIRGKPRCEQCPLAKNCAAKNMKIAEKLPQSKPKKILPTRQTTFLILQKDNSVFLEKRPPTGIWGGLWSLPEIADASLKSIQQFCRQRFRFQVNNIKLGKSFRHTFSHFHLDVLPVFVSVQTSASKLMEAEQQIWYNLRKPDAIGLSAPVSKLLQALST